MEKLQFDSGVKEYRINGGGVLRFNPGDPNVYARFLEAADKLQQLEQDLAQKAKLLCQLHPVRRLETALFLLKEEILVLQLEGEIHEKTRANMDQEQRDYFLREQMKVIRQELGELFEEA